MSPARILDEQQYWQDVESACIRYSGTADFVKKIIVRAQGSYLTDHEGKQILDWTSGQMSSMLGHSHPAVVSALERSAATLLHTFSGFATPPIVQAAKALSDIVPRPLSKAMFLSTGGESNEAAIRMAKLVTGKHEIVGLSASWHGMTQGANGATFSAGRQFCGPPVPGQLCLPAPNAYRSTFRNKDGSYDWQTEFELGWRMVDTMSCGSLAACIVEPILSSGGVLELPYGYLAALRRKCEERGMLLIIDEAQTGLGRTGDMFAFQHEGVTPDILTLSKTLGCGLPVSAVVTTADIEAAAHEKGFLFYTTHVSDPLAGSVASSILDVIVREDLPSRAKVLGEYIRGRLREMAKTYQCIGDVRGRGLLIGVEIIARDDAAQPARELGTAIADKCMDLGLSMNVTRHKGAGIFRIAPPLTSTDEEVEKALAIFESAFKLVKGTSW